MTLKSRISWIQTLPPDIIRLIFAECIRKEDRRNFTLVCKRWWLDVQPCKERFFLLKMKSLKSEDESKKKDENQIPNSALVAARLFNPPVQQRQARIVRRNVVHYQSNNNNNTVFTCNGSCSFHCRNNH